MRLGTRAQRCHTWTRRDLIACDKRGDTDLDGVLDQQRIMYYSANWQLLEERIDEDE